MRYSKIIIFLLLAGLWVNCAEGAVDAYPWRMWQFHVMKPDYIRRVMAQAGEFDVNAVVFSHKIIYNAADILETDAEDSSIWRPNKHGRELQQLAREAHQLDLKTIIWIHELEQAPGEFIRGGKVNFDDDLLSNWIKNKYRALFRLYPEFDGMMLTFHETRYKIFDNEKIRSDLSMPKRFVRLINMLNEVCREQDKTLIVRTFLYEPQELTWLREGLAEISEDVIIQSKCVPHDWQPFYPHNPMIGGFPGRKMIVEFDCSSEFTGRNRIPYCNPEYFLMRWRHDRKFPEVTGYNARLDHAGFDAFFTPNQINLYTLTRVLQNPDIAAEDIWREWTTKTYGEQAAPDVQKALKPTFECVNQAFFAKGFWYTYHSRISDYDYALKSLTRRSLYKWSPDAQDLKRTEELLINPTPEFFEEILAEKDQAIALADECLLHLRAAKPNLTGEQYDDLRFRLDLLRRVTEIWKQHAAAFWGLRLLEQGRSSPGLRERIEHALEALDRQAQISQDTPSVGDTEPASARYIRRFVEDMRRRLKDRKNPS
ncbi:MAG: hypothetical protein JW709_03475 [Sedimentisphaerales bacterium]|nr:hypothetical protein [Sedimentisphaerales bacterium]